jgi:DNA-binding beta-propeller fold protein YncE
VAQGMPVQVAGITREHVESFLADQVARLKASSARSRYASIRQFFRWLEDEGEIRESLLARYRGVLAASIHLELTGDERSPVSLNSVRERALAVGMRAGPSEPGRVLERLKRMRLTSSVLAAMMWLLSCGGDGGVRLRSADDRNHVDAGMPPTSAPAEPRLAASVQVGESPQGVSVTEDTAWIFVQEQDPVRFSAVAVDTTTDEVIRRITLPQDVYGLLATHEGLWLSTATWKQGGYGFSLLRMDPRSGDVTAELPDIRGPLAYGDGTLWATTEGDEPGTSTVVRIDPVSARTVATVALGEQAAYMTVGEGALWVLTLDADGDLLKVNPTTNAVTARVELGAGSPKPPAAGEGAVWVPITRPDFSTFVLRLDPRGGKLVGEPIPLDAQHPVNVALGARAGSVWFIGDLPGGQAVFRLDTATLKPDNTLSMLGPQRSFWTGAALDPTGKTIWISNYGDTVTRVDLDP